jgi:hypothetical protein
MGELQYYQPHFGTPSVTYGVPNVRLLRIELALADPYSINAQKLAFKTLEFKDWRSIAPC